MKNLKINLKKEIDNSYDIKFIENTGKELSDYLLSTDGFDPLQNKILVVSDTNVFPLHYYNLMSEVDKNISLYNIVLEAGEENKNIEAVLKICSKLIELNFNRNDLLVVLGGGVIGDITGMAASIFKRGIDFIQIPTTLLSMFDSSVGGKTGVDFMDVKNIIGAFKQPKLVLINSRYLETLEEKELYSGYFEGLKHSLLEGEVYYKEFSESGNIFLNKNSLSTEGFSSLKNLENKISPLNNSKDSYSSLNNIIKENVSIKAKIVMEDEKETGVRKFLNYGHTFGHALESITNFSLPHGICVGYGMIYVNILSNKINKLSNNNLIEINNFILTKIKESGFNLENINLKNRFEEIYSKMTSDKKNTDSNISFSLLEKPGNLFIEKVGSDRKDILIECFEEFVELIKK